MENYEIKAIIDQYESDFKDKWESTRLVMHSIYQSQATKELKITQILNFPWDDFDAEISNKPTEEDKKRLEKFALEMLTKINK